jgi:PiT family inorganic phosphate transporter
MAFTHGANDAQKTMGVIALALVLEGKIDEFYIPNWVKLAAGLTIAAGTYVGGWRIIRTMGSGIYQMEPAGGFAAQTTAGLVIYASTRAGYPLSTTHVISGAVIGSGATRRLSAVRWGLAGNIVMAWILTIPAAAVVGAGVYYVVSGIS